jgi:hypothetical protein
MQVIAERGYDLVIELACEHAITIFVDFQRENRKSKAEGEIRIRVVTSIAPYFEYKPHNELLSVDSPKRAGNVTPSLARHDTGSYGGENHGNLATLVLQYSKKELTSYTEFRVAGITKASVPWMKRCSLTFLDVTKGTVSKTICATLLYE